MFQRKKLLNFQKKMQFKKFSYNLQLFQIKFQITHTISSKDFHKIATILNKIIA